MHLWNQLIRGARQAQPELTQWKARSSTTSRMREECWRPSESLSRSHWDSVGSLFLHAEGVFWACIEIFPVSCFSQQKSCQGKGENGGDQDPDVLWHTHTHPLLRPHVCLSIHPSIRWIYQGGPTDITTSALLVLLRNWVCAMQSWKLKSKPVLCILSA